MFKGLSELFVALTKYTSGLFFFFSALSLGSIFVSRLPNTDHCIQLTTDNIAEADFLGVVDLVNGRYQVDQRPSIMPFLNLPSPDGKWVVMLRQNPSLDQYSYVLQSASNTWQIVLQENVAGDASSDIFALAVSPYFKWTPDSQFLAYIWKDQDGKAYLSMMQIGSGQKKTVALNRMDGKTISFSSSALPSSNTIIQGWSGDQQYFSIAERIGLGFQVSIWRTSNLQRVPSVFDERILFQGIWLPQGNRYVGVTATRDLEEQPANLVFYDPVEQAEIAVIELPKRQARLLSPSPNNDYVALTSIVEVCNGDTCQEHWQHELFDASGEAVSPIFLGNLLLQSDTPDRLVYANSASVYSGEVFTGLWSGDGQTWVFLQQGADNSDLIRFDLTTRQSSRIALQVSTEWFQILLPAMRFWETGFQSFGAIPMLRTSDRLLVPTQSNNFLRVDLLDIPTNEQTLLFEGAANLSIDRENSLFGTTWNWENDWLAIPWTTSDEQSRLTIARADSSQVATLDMGLETISSVRWLNQHWIAYLVEGTTSDIETMNIDTQISKSLLSGVEKLFYWNVSLAPGRDLATINLITEMGKSEMWLVSLDGDLRRQFDMEASGFSIWSPDGSQVAFLSGRTYRDRQLEIFDVHQNLLRQIPLKRQFAGRPRIQAWTKCY